MEKAGTVSYWDILFGASSFSDLLDRATMVSEIMGYDNEIMDELAATRKALQEQQSALEDTRAEQEAEKADLEARRADLEAKEAEVDGFWRRSLPTSPRLRPLRTAWRPPRRRSTPRWPGSSGSSRP